MSLRPASAARPEKRARRPAPSQRGLPQMANLIRRYYTKRDPDTGRKVRCAAKKWYGCYVDAAGISRRVPLSANKTAAAQMLNELVRRAELAKAGVIDPFHDQRKRPLT